MRRAILKFAGLIFAGIANGQDLPPEVLLLPRVKRST
jgi:hypothetical protein